MRYIHRRLDDGTELYFLANKTTQAAEAVCSLRGQGRQPEFWWPETGRTEPVVQYESKGGVIRLPLRLEAAESVFVVFRAGARPLDPVVSVTRDGRPAGPAAASRPAIVIQKARYGIVSDPSRTRDVRAKLQAMVDGGVVDFQVADLAAGDDPA